MDHEKANEIRSIEGVDAKKRYELIGQIVKEKLEKTALIEEKPFCPEDAGSVKRTIIAVAPFVHRKIYPIYF